MKRISQASLTLTQREQRILKAVILNYIQAAKPISSKYIQQNDVPQVSSATIRNTLHRLEELGYLVQPHTSAGRIPSDNGYRFYVDNLISGAMIQQRWLNLIRKELNAVTFDLNQIMDKTALLLSKLTEQIGIFIVPSLGQEILRKVDLVQMGSNRILVILETSSKVLKTVMLEIETEIKESRLPLIQSLLNERLSGISLKEIIDSIAIRFQDLNEYAIIRVLIHNAPVVFNLTNPVNVKLSGTAFLMQKPDFSDLNQLSQFVSQLEDGTIIAQIVEHHHADREMIISIGSENPEKELQEFSVITKGYWIGESNGTLAIIGPKRMDYQKSISVLSNIAEAVTQIFIGNRSKD
jgi:heat-inducible transcriptional repressor